MPLPIMTDESDIDALIGYLKTKPLGASIAEAKAVIEPKLLDARKITAYKAWGFITLDNERMKLTERGRDFSRASSDKKRSIFGTIIREQRPYFIAIEFVFYKNYEQVTATEVAAHWHDHCRDEVGTDNETTINNQVTCFFNVAQAAGLGTYTIGRRGQPTRFTLDQEALGQFIGETGIVTSDSLQQNSELLLEDSDEADLETILEKANISKPPSKSIDSQLQPSHEFVSKQDHEEAKVFISHSKNMDIVDQIKTMLEVADLEYELAVEEETTAIPVPEKVLSAMRRCSSAIICVTADEQTEENGTYHVNENVLIEIGAAFVLYDKRVVLVWDRRLKVPSNLQGLYRSEFEGNELSWSNGMRLLKAIRNFKSKTS